MVRQTSGKTFVGFGFGPIQSALFLYEAYRSGHFDRFVVAEIDADLVAAVRADGGRYTVNIARPTGIDQDIVAGVELLNPTDPADRAALLDAIAEADELATALPSINIYTAGGDNSVVNLLRQGLQKRTQQFPTIIYAAENHNHAAEALREHLAGSLTSETLDSVQILNTVIGKMSGVITNSDEISQIGLTTLTPDFGRAVLVEEFNRILISRILQDGFQRGITVFSEKDDLLPFEEAKLYGHNAIHAMIAYRADLKGLRTIADAGQDNEIMTAARAAFIEESGAALIHRHAHLGDPLFTQMGYQAYADDLLTRMTNPYLYDLVERVGRDPVRKLGYEDRLYGTMRLALDANITPHHLATGAAAGVYSMITRRDELPSIPANLPDDPSRVSEDSLAALLKELWGDSADQHVGRLVELTFEAWQQQRGT